MRKFGASGLIEQSGQALLGAGEIFDRDQNHDNSEPAWAALSRRHQREDLARQVNLFVGRAHDRVGAVDSQPGLFQFFRCLGVAVVDHQDVQKFAISLGHAGDGNRQALGRHQNAGRSRNCGVADDRTHGCHRARVCLRASTIPGTARMGPMLVTGLLGASSTTVADMMASITPGAGSAFSMPAKRTDLTGS